MNRFQTTPVPYDTTDTYGTKFTVHKVLDNGRLLAVAENDGRPYATLFGPDGRLDHGSDLIEPAMPGLDAYLELNDYVRDLIELTFRNRQKIPGIKALRGLLNIGLTPAKMLWEHLEAQDRRVHAYRYAA